MPFNRSEINQVGFVILPANVFKAPSATNPYVLIPSDYWIRAMRALPSAISLPLRGRARWGSASDIPLGPIRRTFTLAASRLGISTDDFQKIFPSATRQQLVLSGWTPLGLHVHPGVEFACTVASKTFIPLCWPLMAVMAAIGKPPSTAQIILCLVQTALLQAFKQWCADNGATKMGTKGTPNPYFYTR